MAPRRLNETALGLKGETGFLFASLALAFWHHPLPDAPMISRILRTIALGERRLEFGLSSLMADLAKRVPIAISWRSLFELSPLFIKVACREVVSCKPLGVFLFQFGVYDSCGRTIDTLPATISAKRVFPAAHRTHRKDRTRLPIRIRSEKGAWRSFVVF